MRGGVRLWGQRLGWTHPLCECVAGVRGAGVRARGSARDGGSFSCKMLCLGRGRGVGRCRNWWHSEGQAEGPARAQGGGQKSRKEGPQGWGTEGGLVGEHRCDVEDGAWSAGLPGSKRCSAAAFSARAPPCQSVEDGAFRWPWGMVTVGATRVAIGHLRCGRHEVRRVLRARDTRDFQH